MIAVKQKQATGYISAADTAKLIRKVLKRAFAGVKFSVRTRHQSEVSLRWKDGPTERAVKALCDIYEGGGFDGMIDLAYSYYAWLNRETGEAAFAYTSGTVGSAGTVPAAESPNPWPGGELVHFCAKYVSYHREYSKELLEKAIAQVVDEYGIEAPEIQEFGTPGKPWHTWEIVYDPGRDGWQTRRFSTAIDEIDAYVPPAEKPKPPTPPVEPTGQADQADSADGVQIRYERDWTWLYFENARPDVGQADALKGLGGRFSPKRTTIRGIPSVWYIRERVSPEDLRALLRTAPLAMEPKTVEPLGPGGGPSYDGNRREVLQTDWENLKSVVFHNGSGPAEIGARA